jgi:hypothetical protein
MSLRDPDTLDRDGNESLGLVAEESREHEQDRLGLMDCARCGWETPVNVYRGREWCAECVADEWDGDPYRHERTAIEMEAGIA